MQVQILRVGHALVQGSRGDAGGAPSKNSIWGVATVGASLVTFSGRVGGTLRFKARHTSMKDAMITLFGDKLEGKGMDYHYKDVTADHSKVYENLDARILSDYKAAKAASLINVRDANVKAEVEAAPKAKAKAESKAETPKADAVKEAAPKATKAAPKAKAEPKAPAAAKTAAVKTPKSKAPAKGKAKADPVAADAAAPAEQAKVEDKPVDAPKADEPKVATDLPSTPAADEPAAM